MPAVGQRQNSRSLSAYASLPPTGIMSAYPSQKSAAPAYGNTGYGNTMSGNLGPYSLPSVPAYPSMTTGYKPLPPMRPLETLARRGRPRWGLRFLMLLIVAGGATYFLRPYISWIDNRVTPVENRLRELAAQYGLGDLLARVLPDRNAKPVATAPAPAPAAPAAPVAVERAKPAAAPAPRAAVAAKAPGARPDIEPISPRAARGSGAAAGPTSRAAALKQSMYQRRAAARETRRAAAAARWRASAARRRMALVAANTSRLREPAMPSDEEIGGAARPAPAAAAAPKPAVAPPPRPNPQWPPPRPRSRRPRRSPPPRPRSRRAPRRAAAP